MTSGTGSGLVSRNKEGTQIVLAQFPPSGSTLSAFGLTPSVIKSIAIPNDIQEWPTTALNGCTNLEKITTFGMPAKEATIVLSLDHGLRNLTNLKFIHLPSTLQKIADGFSSDDGSGNVFPRSLQSVTFQDCSFLQSIGYYAFFNCSVLNHIDLSGCPSLQSIRQDALRSCSFIHLDLSSCPLLQSIGSEAFVACSSLIYIDFSYCSLLQSIGNNAFWRCSSLFHIDFSGCFSLQSIGSSAFYYCTQLQTAIFPASLTTIGTNAFLGDTALKTVYWMGSGPAANIGSNAFPSGVEHVYNYNPNA